MCAHIGDSHRLGLVTLTTGGSATAYRAVVDLSCAECGSPILPGEIFSRRTRRMSQMQRGVTSVTPTCTRCRPLRLTNASEDDDVGY